MASLHGVTNITTMKAAFPSLPMVHDGPQTLQTLLAIQQHLINCAQSFWVDGRPLGLLNLAIPAQVYVLYTSDAYPVRTADPGVMLQFANNAGPVA